MSSPPPSEPSLPLRSNVGGGVGGGVAAASNPASPAPQSPVVSADSPSTPDVPAVVGGGGSGEDQGGGGGGEEAGAELPMTMAASVMLTSLPRDARSALEGAGDVGVDKVKIHFRAVGSAPALRQPVRKLSSTARFEAVVRFLRKQLRLQDHESVFCYVNSVFAPGLDEGIGNLWRCFKVKDELVVAYSITPAFG